MTLPQASKPKLKRKSKATGGNTALTKTSQAMTASNLCYTTRTGIKIGSSYTPPARVRMTAEDEHWQAVLLGIKPSPNLALFVSYIIGILAFVKYLIGTK